MSLYQISLVQIHLRDADYPRPCVSITVLSDSGEFGALAISSKMDLYRRDLHFLIREDHPDFPATGLKVTSYAIGAPVFRIAPDRVIRSLGELRGELAKEFAKWIGD